MTDQWMTLKAKRDDLERQVRQVDREMEAVAANMFLEHLRSGQWKLEYGRLRPADSKAEDATVNILSDALRLGYHDRFMIHDEHIAITGQVDDGNLTLHLTIRSRSSIEDVKTETKLLRVNMNLAPLLRERLQEELERALNDRTKAQERTKALQNALNGLSTAHEPA